MRYTVRYTAKNVGMWRYHLGRLRMEATLKSLYFQGLWDVLGWLGIGKWCPEAESNHRHEDFQSSALPTELSGLVEVFLALLIIVILMTNTRQGTY